jgi:hypothetical protein
LPGIVLALSSAAFFGAFFVGLRRVGWKRGLAVSPSVVALWAVPFVLLYQSNAVVGHLVQPRYVLPLMVIALGVASLRPDAHQAWAGARIWAAGIALTLAFGAALHTNIRRYTTGLDEFHIDPGANAEWWWSGALSPMADWIIGTVAFAAVIVMWALVLPGAERKSLSTAPSEESEREFKRGHPTPSASVTEPPS